MRRIALLVLGFITVSACDDDNAGGGIADRAPDMRPWAAGPPLEASLEATSGEDVFLSYVRDVDVDSEGRVYVIDYQTAGVIALDPDLTHDRIVGRDGAGPGEFESMSNVQVLRGDSLLVWDRQLQRVTVFPPGSDEAAYVDPLGIQDLGSEVYGLPEKAGYVVSFNLHPYMADGSNEGQTRMIALRHLYGEGSSVAADLLFEYPAGEALVVRGEGSVSVGSQPFGQQSFWSLLGGDRLVYARSDALEVKVLDLGTRGETAFSYETTRIDVTARELDSAADGLGREMANVLRQGAPYLWPTLTGMVTDDEMRIWLGIRKTDLSTWEWAAFTPDGTHRMSVDLPAGFDLYAVRDGRMIGVGRDELDVPQMRAYRLPR